MSEVKKIATRASYGAALVELGKKHENLVVLDADLAANIANVLANGTFPVVARPAAMPIILHSAIPQSI